MQEFCETRGDFTLSSAKDKLNKETMFELLSTTHWAHLRSRSQVELSVDTSLVFGILTGGRQVAMARVVTDFMSFAWICDVVVAKDFRGLGFGKWLMEAIERHPALGAVRRYVLCTKTAHGLYQKLGYLDLPNDTTSWMIRLFPEREGKAVPSQALCW